MTDLIVTENQKIFLDLIERSPDMGDGWRTVSDALWPHALQQAHPLLTELDRDNKRVRLTDDGMTFMMFAPSVGGYK